MQYLYKSIFIIAFIYRVILTGGFTYFEVGGLLVIMSVDIFRERFKNNAYLLAGELFIILGMSILNTNFIFLAGASAFDIMRLKAYPLLIVAFLSAVLLTASPMESIMIISISAFSGYFLNKFISSEITYKKVYDQERRNRYELEETRAKLMASAKEAAHIAEIKERNRIARDLHDSVGHNLAGILMQMQAANSLFEKDKDKSSKLYEKSIEGLSQTLSLMRDTVHNLRPADAKGIDYIKKIIDNYTYCKVDFSIRGNFGIIPADYVEIISSNIKEALTNISRHSNADTAEIRIDVNQRFLKLYIKDNGSGCSSITEGLGLSGMRERTRNTGGSFSVNFDEGFMIICIMPFDKGVGGKIFENTDS